MRQNYLLTNLDKTKTILIGIKTYQLTLSYTGGEGGRGGRKVVTLISIIENFGEIQAIVMKLGNFS